VIEPFGSTKYDFVFEEQSAFDDNISYTDNETGTKIDNFQIIGTEVISPNNIQLKFAVSDGLNNLIHKRKFSANNFKMRTFTDTDNLIEKQPINSKILAINEFALDDNVINNICFCLDNSDAAMNNISILNMIENASGDLPRHNKYYLSFFNQNFGGVTEIKRNEAGDGKFFPDFK